MAKQRKTSDLAEEVSKYYSSNTLMKLPQRSVSPNFSYPNQANNTKIYKENSIHQISKQNSSILLKKKSLKRIKSISALHGKSPSVLQMKKNSKLSLNHKKLSLKAIEGLLPDLSSINGAKNRSLTPNEKNDITIDIETSDLSAKSNTKLITFEKRVEKHEIYSKMFDEIIQKVKTFSPILKKIKENYEEFYKISLIELTQNLKDKIDALTSVINKKCEEIITLDKRVKKLSTENYELAKSLERSEEICSRIQGRLNKISKFDPNEISTDIET